MIFKPMTLDEAKDFYNLMKESRCAICKIGMDDIWFFTNGLTQDYGNTNKEETREALNDH